MSTAPAYFDSQAQASSVLHVDIEDIREAKRNGCPAFRSGRVYRAELEEWLARDRAKEARHRVPTAQRAAAPAYLRGPATWQPDERREPLFGLMDALEEAHADGKLPLAEFVGLAQATLPLVLKIGERWGAEIDAAGYAEKWHAIIGHTANGLAVG